MKADLEVIGAKTKDVAAFYCETSPKFDLPTFLTQMARFMKRFYEARKVSSVLILVVLIESAGLVLDALKLAK